ncbi:SDR family oxidoreductase [Vallicoccus soli]|uniref:SDR family oxidoreductase n=1 Tax=Vallicoccus soli TaxID=2339232 RepID=A0A3A3Z051_9ACTN|nr:SDR family oxidoreductase [Vallicoccus soli]RJK97629.1 SDR family oxidoreductase [Vallicoccus soli]
MALSVLFLGGTGIISSACVARAQAVGHEVTVVNRGATSARPVPDGVEVLHADVRDPAALRGALGGRSFDVVADFVAFLPQHVEDDVALLAGRTGHYVLISSASAYRTPPGRLPVVESTPLRNPYWQYSRDKIACEDALVRAYRDTGFPGTVVRPSHTYDRTLVPTHGGWTDVDRMRRGLPVLVHGDGTSLWTLTHHADFARAFVGLLGHPDAVGEAFHITSDEAMAWDRVYEALGAAAGVPAPRLVHVPSEVVAEHDPETGASLLGDKAHSMVFDNSKVKRLVPGWEATTPFHVGAREVVAWYDADPARRRVDAGWDALSDRLTRR